MAAAARMENPLYAGDVTPADAWSALQQKENAQLVDVRTQAEWAFAGVPSLDTIGKTVKTISWKFYPQFNVNPDFISQLEAAVTDKTAQMQGFRGINVTHTHDQFLVHKHWLNCPITPC
jgi:rhodanese-related sulfurtransferase